MENSPRGPYGKIILQYDDSDFVPVLSRTSELIVTDADILKGDYTSILANLDKLPEPIRNVVKAITAQEKVSYQDKIFLEKINKKIIDSNSIKGKIISLIKKALGKNSTEIELSSFGGDVLTKIEEILSQTANSVDSILKNNEALGEG